MTAASFPVPVRAAKSREGSEPVRQVSPRAYRILSEEAAIQTRRGLSHLFGLVTPVAWSLAEKPH
jgi:hypothetical protein